MSEARYFTEKYKKMFDRSAEVFFRKPVIKRETMKFPMNEVEVQPQKLIKTTLTWSLHQETNKIRKEIMKILSSRDEINAPELNGLEQE